MSDNDLGNVLRDALRAVHKERAAEFADAWAAAEQRHQQARRRYATISGVAAAIAVVAVVAGFWPSRQAAPTDEYLIADSLLNSTQWLAPSDALMPQHRYDIYQEIPILLESTGLEEGLLL